MTQTLPSEYQTLYDRRTSASTKLDAQGMRHGPEKCTRGTYLRIITTFLVFLASSGVTFWNLGNPSVSQVDEERHIQVVREMVQSNDYWHPTFLGGEPYYHKPPLKFWLAAFVIEVFGESLRVHRAVDAFSGAMTAVLVFILVVRVCGLAGGFYSIGALFSCQALFLAHGFRDAVQDGLLVALTFACFVIGSLLMREKISRRAELHLLAGILGGLAVLTKSVAGFLPLISFISYCLLHRVRHERGHLLLYLTPYLTIPLLYFMPHSILVDGAFETLVEYEIVNRLVSGYHNSSNSYYYLQIIAGGGYSPPLIVLIPTLLWAGSQTVRGGTTPLGYLLWSTLVILVLATVAQSRLPHYIYPTLPLFSVLCGMFVSDLSKRGSTLGSLCAGCAVAAIAHGAFATVWHIVMQSEPSAVVKLIREVGQAHENTAALISKQVHVPQSLEREVELHFTRAIGLERFARQPNHSVATDLLIVGTSELPSKPFKRLPRSYLTISRDFAPDSSLLLLSYISSALPNKPLQLFKGAELSEMGAYGWLRDRTIEQKRQLISVATESALIIPGDILSERLPVLLKLEVQVTRPSLAGALNLEVMVNSQHIAVKTLGNPQPEVLSLSLQPGVLREGSNILILRQIPLKDTLAIGMQVRSLSLELRPAS